MTDLLILAKDIAIEAHKGQKRWDGLPYITHPAAVANLVRHDIDCQIVAWLHDVLEDTKVTPEILINKGIPKHIVSSLYFLTRKKDENYFTFITRVSLNKTATIVKVADLTHNLSNLKEGSMKDKYRFAKHYLEH